ncbi:DNA-directed RNA polymerase II subunit GRINL1A [Condylostylus longicornis]|uniref:DNA-directed RNA polymerase II subunit GRINL1A n=1 Tax=Condylostylus longicornis TaxID=2530218 RepID=UPI00244E3052|nr:DNA-directed RNA polymerase II subunit GRINL1A [Condylostylus longicornis]
MDIILRPKLTKIPGELIKTKADKFTQDLSKLTKAQLLEIKEREEKLLSKKSQLANLPDKGQKIENFYKKVLIEISKRNEIDEAARLFSDLNISSTGHEKLTNLEWTGKLNSEDCTEVVLDSDDEEIDPVKIIAQSTDMKKHVKYIQAEESLITKEDLKQIEEMKSSQSNGPELVVDSDLIHVEIPDEFREKLLVESNCNSPNQCETNSSNSSLNLEPHALYLLEKGVDGLPKKEKFLPYKTTKTNVHDPRKEKNRKVGGKYWEITAATPPPIQNAGVKMLSLKDSVEIQMEYTEKLKKLQEKQAAERLAARTAIHPTCDIILPDEQIRKVNKFFGSYREHDLSSDESDNGYENERKYNSEDEIHDEEEDRGGVVNFQISK